MKWFFCLVVVLAFTTGCDNKFERLKKDTLDNLSPSDSYGLKDRCENLAREIKQIDPGELKSPKLVNAVTCKAPFNEGQHLIIVDWLVFGETIPDGCSVHYPDGKSVEIPFDPVMINKMGLYHHYSWTLDSSPRSGSLTLKLGSNSSNSVQINEIEIGREIIPGKE